MENSIVSICKDIFRIMLASVKQFLTIHLIYVFFGTIIFSPQAGIIGQALLRLSGKSTLSDFDILYFFLTPAGMFSAVLFEGISPANSFCESEKMVAGDRRQLLVLLGIWGEQQ